MHNTKKYLPIFIISLIIPALFMFATSNIAYKTPESNPSIADELFTSGRGWPLPIYDIQTSGGIAGNIKTAPRTDWVTFFIEFLIIFVASFSIGTLIMTLSNKK